MYVVTGAVTYTGYAFSLVVGAHLLFYIIISLHIVLQPAVLSVLVIRSIIDNPTPSNREPTAGWPRTSMYVKHSPRSNC